MTDEERAEKYTDSINTIIYDIDDNAINIAKYLRKAYLDGLTEDKPKWHDLRKNPDDLPKENGDYWCKLKSNRLYTFEVYYTDSLFYKSRWGELDIIAWCELPKFEEVKK